METAFFILMVIGYLAGDHGVKDRLTHPCNKPYICKESKADTKACLKEAMDYQMENCFRR